MVATEAHATSERAKHKTIDAEHVLAALTELGMPELAAQCTETVTADKAQQKDRAEAKRGKSIESIARAQGMTLQELEAAQAAKFAQAREAFLKQQAGAAAAAPALP
jgi:hypothetical protein